MAPAMASTISRNGTPSRRSSFARVSLPNSRAAPPTTWARPIQALDSRPCSGGAFFGSFLVGWVRERDEFRDVRGTP